MNQRSRQLPCPRFHLARNPVDFGVVKKVLITGIAGGQAQLVARKLLRRQRGYQIVGVDRTVWETRPRGVSMYLADLRKRKFEDVIRRERPDVIVHLASVRHFKSHPALRHEVNVNGTKRLLTSPCRTASSAWDLVERTCTGRCRNPYYMDDSAEFSTYPEMRDLAEMDMLATAYLWRFRDRHHGAAAGERARLPRAQRDRPLPAQ